MYIVHGPIIHPHLARTLIFELLSYMYAFSLTLILNIQEAGCPDGVVNVIHGQHDCVNFICDHPDIK